jgi:hypothetical protein
MSYQVSNNISRRIFNMHILRLRKGVKMNKAQKEIFKRGLSPSNNHHHGKAYRLRKIEEKKKEKRNEFMHLPHDSEEV